MSTRRRFPFRGAQTPCWLLTITLVAIAKPSTLHRERLPEETSVRSKPNMAEGKNGAAAPTKPGILRLSNSHTTGARGASPTVMDYRRRASSSEVAANSMLDDIDVSLNCIIGIVVLRDVARVQCSVLFVFVPLFPPIHSTSGDVYTRTEVAFYMLIILI